MWTGSRCEAYDSEPRGMRNADRILVKESGDHTKSNGSLIKKKGICKAQSKHDEGLFVVLMNKLHIGQPKKNDPWHPQ